MSEELAMARGFYGFGRWEAPFWFIGPEPGKGPDEEDDNHSRVRAWAELGRPELCDCKVFHQHIGEESWHREEKNPRLQPTWRPLILCLMTVLDKPSERADLRVYQRERWGSVTGETCVIELSGHAARRGSMSIEVEMDRAQRIELIRSKLTAHKPALVLMYGIGKKEHWWKIASDRLEPDSPVQLGSTMFVLATHPNTVGRKNLDWKELGEAIRKERGHKAP